MKQTELIMGMPITVGIIDLSASREAFAQVFSYFHYIDQTFSTYLADSEISRINAGYIHEEQYSHDMRTVFLLARQTEQESNGYFNIKRHDMYDPSGVVKGWAIYNAAKILKDWGYENFYIDAGGDIQVSGKNKSGLLWIVGIRNPFNQDQVVKRVALSSEGIATSGTYIRGNHIYNPHKEQDTFSIASLTVIGPNVYEADRFATAAFAMGSHGIEFINRKKGFEGYMIDINGLATYTSGFENYAVN